MVHSDGRYHKSSFAQKQKGVILIFLRFLTLLRRMIKI